MDISELTLRLLLLFVPGIICFLIVEELTTHRERKTHEVVFLILLLGTLSYLIYGGLAAVGVFVFSSHRFEAAAYSGPRFFESLTDPKSKLDFFEIGFVTIVSAALGIFWSFCDNRKFLYRLGTRLSITNKFGDPDVWTRTLNTENLQWCVVRDLSRQLMFQGYIVYFSDVEEVRELFLAQVQVYNEQTAELSYSAEYMYLARKRDDVTVEFQSDPKDRRNANVRESEPESANHEAAVQSPTPGSVLEEGGTKPGAAGNIGTSAQAGGKQADR